MFKKNKQRQKTKETKGGEERQGVHIAKLGARTSSDVREKGDWRPLMGPPSGHLFYSRGMTVLKPPIGIPANSAGNAEISEQRRARWLGFQPERHARRKSADL